FVDTGDEVEQRRLACTVGPDDTYDLTLGDLERQVGDRLQATEGLVHVADLEHPLTLPISAFAVRLVFACRGVVGRRRATTTLTASVQPGVLGAFLIGRYVTSVAQQPRPVGLFAPHDAGRAEHHDHHQQYRQRDGAHAEALPGLFEDRAA